MNAVALFIIFILFVGLLAPLSFLTYLFFILPVFGSLALLPPSLTNSNLTAGSFAALFFVIKALSTPNIFQASIRSIMAFRRLGFLWLFLIIAILGSIILPRVFEGTIRVYAMRSGQLEFVAPSIANHTQAAYLMLSTLTAIVVAALVWKASFMNLLSKAILIGAYAIIITGVMDVLANAAGIPQILSYFRTASYVFMTDNFVEGSRRIIGLMPEASSYGSMAAGSCGLLLFLRPIFPLRLWRWHVPIAAWGCGFMALLSTSSTAYVMMAVVLVIYTFYGIDRVTSDGHILKKAISKKILAFVGVAVLGLIVLIFDADLASHFAKLIDTLIFEKQNSSSYADRTRSTMTALDAFLASDGMGVGVGSVRTSNLFVNILASTGIVGSSLFVMFLWIIFTRRAPETETRANVTIRAAKLALIPIFVGGALAGTTPDFGPLVGALFGIIAGVGHPPTSHTWVSPRLRKNQKIMPREKQRISASPDQRTP